MKQGPLVGIDMAGLDFRREAVAPGGAPMNCRTPEKSAFSVPAKWKPVDPIPAAVSDSSVSAILQAIV
jgi:hypothetical protein